MCVIILLGIIQNNSYSIRRTKFTNKEFCFTKHQLYLDLEIHFDFDFMNICFFSSLFLFAHCVNTHHLSSIVISLQIFRNSFISCRKYPAWTEQQASKTSWKTTWMQMFNVSKLFIEWFEPMRVVNAGNEQAVECVFFNNNLHLFNYLSHFRYQCFMYMYSSSSIEECFECEWCNGNGMNECYWFWCVNMNM